ncbi:MAG: sel1 repeat family protein [Muribaculaceae bacterium]|nr:sel1 repeat family protein [Muribaculaceae bacterium]
MEQKFITLLSVLIILLSSCSNTVERADKLRLDNKFEEAAELYKQAASEGNAYAKWRLAKAYSNGDGIEYNEEIAWSLLKEAADAGCPQARCDVALSYIYGLYGIDENVEKGKQMLESLCSNTQDSYSLTRYAVELLNGSNFDINEERAMFILDNIQDKKEPYYLRIMSYIYFNGINNIEVDNNKQYFGYFLRVC